MVSESRKNDPFGQMNLDVGDPDPGVRLITTVNGDQVGGERLDLAAIAQAAKTYQATYHWPFQLHGMIHFCTPPRSSA